MHAYRAFIQNELDRRGWSAAELARHSGLTKQTISNLLSDDRPSLRVRPSDETILGLSQAFRVRPEVVLQAIAEAMGLPAGLPVTRGLDEYDELALLDEVSARIRAGRGEPPVWDHIEFTRASAPEPTDASGPSIWQVAQVAMRARTELDKLFPPNLGPLLEAAVASAVKDASPAWLPDADLDDCVRAVVTAATPFVVTVAEVQPSRQDFGLVADDASGAHHQEEDEAREEQP